MPHPHAACTQSHRGCTLALKRVHPSPQGVHASTLMRHVPNLIEDALRPQKSASFPSRDTCLTLMRHVPNLIEDALCPHKECILPLKGHMPQPSCGMYPIS